MNCPVQETKKLQASPGGSLSTYMQRDRQHHPMICRSFLLFNSPRATIAAARADVLSQRERCTP
jgi:hypothetical protein